jgi:hypothetical protein
MIIENKGEGEKGVWKVIQYKRGRKNGGEKMRFNQVCNY